MGPHPAGAPEMAANLGLDRGGIEVGRADVGIPPSHRGGKGDDSDKEGRAEA